MLKGIIIDFNIVQIKFVNLSKKWNLIKSDELSIIEFQNFCLLNIFRINIIDSNYENA